MLALALIDGWGEAWQAVAATTHNAGLMSLASQGGQVADMLKTPHDMRRQFAWIDDTQTEQSQQDWESTKATFAAMFGVQ